MNNNKSGSNYCESNGIVWLNSTDESNQAIKMNPDSNTQKIEDELDSDDQSSSADNNEEIVLNDDDVWDDSILIKSYEQSQLIIKKALMKQHGSEEKKNIPEKSETIFTEGKEINKKVENEKKHNKKKSKANIKAISANGWKINDYCRAVYAEDQEEYEAEIININERDHSCLIKYIGYENEEWHLLDDLKPSLGDQIRQKQIVLARQSGYYPQTQPELNDVALDYQSSIENFNDPRNNIRSKANNLSIPPPPPFVHTSGSIPNEEDSLVSMLMSWYMTGYHTGYYQAQKDAAKNKFGK